MRKSDIFVIGIGVATAFVALTLTAPAKALAQDALAPDGVSTETSTMTAEQQSAYESWPSDRQAAYNSWSAEAQIYFWSLNPMRQDYFWMLSDDDRNTLVVMDPVSREEAWQRFEARSGGSEKGAGESES